MRDQPANWRSTALKIKQLHLVAEIRVTAGRRKFGTCAARFTLEKGSEASFHKVCEQIYKTFHEWTLVETDGRAVSRMEKAFRV